MAEDLFLCRLELFGPGLELMPGEIQIVRAIDRHEVHMGMRYFETHYGDATTITRERLLYRFCNRPGEQKDAAQIIFGHIEEIIDLDLGHDQRMSFPQRKDIEECKELIVFGYLICGDLSGNDL